MSGTLQTQGFTQLVADQAAVVQGNTGRASLDLSVGSCLLAILQAFASVGLWLQGLILQVLAKARLATAVGADVDSFVNDYNMTRLPAVAATGQETFARYTTTATALVPVGGQVQTQDGTQSYTVVADTTNAAYSASVGGYPLAIGQASVVATVAANTAGAAGNAAIGTVNTFASGMPGIDTCSNAAAFAGGADAETDAAVKVRFVAYIASLARATVAAIGYAITSVQQGLLYTLTECADPSGAEHDGFFFAVVDDGTGYPPSSLLTAAGNNINLYRAAGIQFAVFPPSVVTVTISFTVTAASGYTLATVEAACQAAVVNYTNGLSEGQTLPWSGLVQAAWGASAGVANITNMLLNGGTGDLSATSLQVFRTTTSGVTVN
jgi:uncharacterized phage protein gp47/JayE